MYRPYWDYPEIDEWDDEERDKRPVVVVGGFCYPRQGFCYPRQGFCYPHQGFCFPRQGFCRPRREERCYPYNPCFPI